MKNKKMMLILVLVLVIGFATVSTTLYLNGTIGVSTKKSDFDVIFTKAILDGTENTEIIDNATKQTITFTSKEMTTLNDTTKLEYEVANKSRLYDADVSVVCNIVDALDKPTTSEYITMEYLPTSNKITVEAGKTGTGSITARLKKVSADAQEIKVKCELNVSSSEREELGEEYIAPYNVSFNSNDGNDISTDIIVKYGQPYGELPIPTNSNPKAVFLGWYTDDGKKVNSTTTVELKEAHTLKASWYELLVDKNSNASPDVGDEIKVGTEQFYVISNNGTELNALAKYNLNVGGNKNGAITEGIQQSGSNYTVAFSNQKGWPYANGDTIDIKQYDGPVKDALYGASGYEKYIKQTINDATVRLITLGELIVLGCSGNYCTSAPSWVYSTSYWTQSAYSVSDYIVWYVRSDGVIQVSDFRHTNVFGVRPVVTIPLS